MACAMAKRHFLFLVNTKGERLFPEWDHSITAYIPLESIPLCRRERAVI